MSLFAGSRTDSKRSPRLKILVVDDDRLSQHLMQVLLNGEGYQVEVASNGSEAFETIKYQPFDVVLMDLQMPVMDGLEASRCIRQWEKGGRHTFIIALTASYLPDDGRSLLEAGIDDYISKPFEVKHMQRILKQRAEAIFLPPLRDLQ
jgi:CheY-like chemotaxis protein